MSKESASKKSPLAPAGRWQGASSSFLAGVLVNQQAITDGQVAENKSLAEARFVWGFGRRRPLG